MFQNLGLIDRLIRLAAGLGLGAVAFALPGLWWLGVIGIVLLLTSGVGICPLYLPFGLNTLFRKKS